MKITPERTPRPEREQILVVEPDEQRRSFFDSKLKDSFEVLFARTGSHALMLTMQNRRRLALILLDLNLPDMTGLQFVKEKARTPQMVHIPVLAIADTPEEGMTVLEAGAADVVEGSALHGGLLLHRISQCLELCEQHRRIRSTERDTLTGLYHRDVFIYLAAHRKRLQPDVPMDAVCVRIEHDEILVEQYGRETAESILRRMADVLEEFCAVAGGICCRSAAADFFLYLPHQQEYRHWMTRMQEVISGIECRRVRLRVGVYAQVDSSMDVERCMERAQVACRSAKARPGEACFYDAGLRDREGFERQMLSEFRKGMEEGQFQVYYQPKFDIQTEIPVIAAAEALVRWQHPTLGLVSPEVFVPAFERNGLIQELDAYVWRETAEQIRKWEKKFDFSVQVSVNVSRVDLYDPQLPDRLESVISGFHVTPSQLMLEITEEAYLEDNEQIAEAVERLHRRGFQIEIDDFGAGVASLKMLSRLPVDAIKLDTHFFRHAAIEEHEARMLRAIIDIADDLSIRVVAEGVETREQLDMLDQLGCSMVQGFYFSKPVPPGEYERILSRQKKMEEKEDNSLEDIRTEEAVNAFGTIALALSSGFEMIYYVDTVDGHYVEFGSKGRMEDLQMTRSGPDFFEDLHGVLSEMIVPEERERVIAALERESLLAHLTGGQRFAMTYLRSVEGKSVPYTLKAVRARIHDSHHLVIGVMPMEV